MKTKTNAAKVLLKAGWTWEEIVAVLENPQPVLVPSQWWQNPVITWDGKTTATNGGDWVVRRHPGDR